MQLQNGYIKTNKGMFYTEQFYCKCMLLLHRVVIE